MSLWDEQFESHGVWAALASAREQLEAADEQIQDGDQRESHARLGRVLDYLESALKATDPELVPTGVLDQLAATVNQLAALVQQFIASPQQALLDQANAQADQAITQALPLASNVAPADAQELQAAVSSFRRSAGQHLRNVEADVQAVDTKAAATAATLAEQEAKIEAQDARLDTVVTDFQAQFSAAQDARQTQFAQAVEEGRAQFRTTVTEGETALKATTDAATTKLTELLTEVEEKNTAMVTAAQERADKQFKESREESLKTTAELDELLEKAVKTVGAIGSTGMAGGYKIVADDEKKQADRWRIVTAVALLGAIGATIFAVAHGVTHGFHVDTFFAKWAISVPFAALAGYAGRESSKHRDEATGNRKIELQLASLDTYLVSLPEEKQEEIKAKLADRFFGELPALGGERAGASACS
jgi:hypothetical protein